MNNKREYQDNKQSYLDDNSTLCMLQTHILNETSISKPLFTEKIWMCKDDLVILSSYKDSVDTYNEDEIISLLNHSVTEFVV